MTQALAVSHPLGTCRQAGGRGAEHSHNHRELQAPGPRGLDA